VGSGEPRVVLLSGGLDSSALAFLLNLRSPRDFGLFVDYGHVTAAAERRASKRIAETYGFEIAEVSVPGLITVGAGTLARQGPAEKADGLNESQKAEWFPARNLLLVSIGAAFLGARGGGTLLIGRSEMTYRDTTLEFVNAANNALLQAFDPRAAVRLESPSAPRLELLAAACIQGFEPRLTFSCNRRDDRHCWRCTSCMDRERFLKETSEYS
jgi:7-cyano-7-deazaguanine synthase